MLRDGFNIKQLRQLFIILDTICHLVKYGLSPINSSQCVPRSIEKRSFNKMQYPSMSRIEDSRVRWSATGDPIRKFRAEWIGEARPWCSRPDEGLRESGLFREPLSQPYSGELHWLTFLKVAQVSTCDRLLNNVQRVLRIERVANARLTENLNEH